MKLSPPPHEERPATFEVCILTGGLSARMGRDKARLKLGGRTMLAIIRETARKLDPPVRTIRRDLVPRCGPLGGIITGLRTTRADAVLFLACDMPLLSPALLARFRHSSNEGGRAVFASQQGRLGFPILLPRSTLAVVEEQINQRCLSLHDLAKAVGARPLRVSNLSHELLNVNTPEDQIVAAALLRTRRTTK